MSNLPEDSTTRKRIPVYSGFLAYFPRAVAAVAAHSLKANEKHNPGQPLHWSHDKSNDHVDCIARHLLDPEGVDEFGDKHDIAVAWRAMAALETRLRNEAAAIDAAIDTAVEHASAAFEMDNKKFHAVTFGTIDEIDADRPASIAAEIKAAHGEKLAKAIDGRIMASLGTTALPCWPHCGTICDECKPRTAAAHFFNRP